MELNLFNWGINVVWSEKHVCEDAISMNLYPGSNSKYSLSVKLLPFPFWESIVNSDGREKTPGGTLWRPVFCMHPVFKLHLSEIVIRSLWWGGCPCLFLRTRSDFDIFLVIRPHPSHAEYLGTATRDNAVTGAVLCFEDCEWQVLCVCVCVCVFACMYVCMYAYVYVCMYVCM